ncbi:hypothetical protein [Vibrio owensii]|uniref:hypothetical protein n=1 Tax=Vibrio owensii TaxID=696485 RepID=UPI003CE4B7FA
MATILAPSAKKPVYNGTHGNLSAVIAEASVNVKDGDEIVLAKLDVGVKLARIVLSAEALGSGVSGAIKLKPKGETAVTVIASASLATAAVKDSDEAGWFPASLLQVKHDVVLQLTGANVTGKKVKYRIETISEGNL